jgi:membrane complex biogenesis BtpA family protein
MSLLRDRAVIGVIHLPPTLGQPDHPGPEAFLETALRDARHLEAGGAQALLLENWRDDVPGPFVGREAVASLAAAARAVVDATDLPVGINVLPNDYTAAFSIARACGLAFVQMDVFVDHVRTDYSYSKVDPFEIQVDLDDVQAFRARVGAEHVALLVTVHPKHYTMLEAGKTLAQSVAQAVEAGADAVVVTGSATGSAPDPQRLIDARQGHPSVPIVLGSGLTPENAPLLAPHMDAAIVGTSLRTPDFSRVVPEQVQALVEAVRQV